MTIYPVFDALYHCDLVHKYIVFVGWEQHRMRFGYIETVCNVLLAVKIFFKSVTCENTTYIVRRVPLCLTTL